MKTYKFYLWCGSSYLLDELEITTDTDLDMDSQSLIEEVAIKAIKEDKGLFLNVNDETEEDLKELEGSPSYLYLDLTEHDLGCYYMLIDNLRWEEVQ